MSVVRRLLGVFLLSTGLAQAADCPRIVSQSPYLTMALQWLDRGESPVPQVLVEEAGVDQVHAGVLHPPDILVDRHPSPHLLRVLHRRWRV